MTDETKKDSERAREDEIIDRVYDKIVSTKDPIFTANVSSIGSGAYATTCAVSAVYSPNTAVVRPQASVKIHASKMGGLANPITSPNTIMKRITDLFSKALT